MSPPLPKTMNGERNTHPPDQEELMMAMKNNTFSFAVTSLFTLLFTAFAIAQPSPSTANRAAHLAEEEIAALSVAFGHMIAENLNQPGLQLDLKQVIEGMQQASQGLPSPLDEKEYERLMTAVQERAFQSIAEGNLIEAELFLKENQTSQEVVSLADGKLQYRVLSQGSGEAVTLQSNPLISYRGSFIDGTLFSSSEEAGGPITIALEQTVPGFQQAVTGMREGERREILIHPDLAYGTSGQLPPNALLIFEVEVIQTDVPSSQAHNEEELPGETREELASEPQEEELPADVITETVETPLLSPTSPSLEEGENEFALPSSPTLSPTAMSDPQPATAPSSLASQTLSEQEANALVAEILNGVEPHVDDLYEPSHEFLEEQAL